MFFKTVKNLHIKLNNYSHSSSFNNIYFNNFLISTCVYKPSHQSTKHYHNHQRNIHNKFKKFTNISFLKSYPSLSSSPYQRHFSLLPRVAIVGSGPAGFYTAQHIVKHIPDSKVDLFERLPIPFGLVRYGVAPDHQDVKNVTNTFSQIAENPNVSFYGNVQLGAEISLKDLQQAYSAVVLAYGADEDKLFDIAGENLKNVMPASSFINWYNAYPGFQDLDVNLDCEACVVLGQGNVAVDVARMLLTPLPLLLKTDMSAHAIDKLRTSRIEKVYLVGRRGVLHAAFTIAEVRELTKLPSCSMHFTSADFEELEARIDEVPRAKKRLMQLLIKQSQTSHLPPRDLSKELHMVFKRSPISFLSHPSDPSMVGGVELAVNQLKGEFGVGQEAVSTSERQQIKAGLVIKSIGYRSVRVDDGVPFDAVRGLVPNQAGRVTGKKGLYCSGWLKTGPRGVLASTMNSAYETGMSVVEDYKEGAFNQYCPQHLAIVLSRIKNKCVTFSEWKKIDAYEKEMGKKEGKVREKIVDLRKMLEIARKTS